MDDLAETLSAPRQLTEAIEVFRGLIDRIVIHPAGEASHKVELIGELPALLSLAANDNAAAIAAASNSLKLVAGLKPPSIPALLIRFRDKLPYGMGRKASAMQ